MGVSLVAGVSVLHKLRKKKSNVALGRLSAAAGAQQWK